jgi:hypothetical protein
MVMLASISSPIPNFQVISKDTHFIGRPKTEKIVRHHSKKNVPQRRLRWTTHLIPRRLGQATWEATKQRRNYTATTFNEIPLDLPRNQCALSLNSKRLNILSSHLFSTLDLKKEI